MGLESIRPAKGSVHARKRVGRGQGSGMGKTATKGHKGQKARSGFKIKRGFEGGQQPIQRRVPKVGFVSHVEKPYVINIEKFAAIAKLEKITLESIKEIHSFPKSAKSVKLIGKGANELAAKIDDKRVKTSRSKIDE